MGWFGPHTGRRSHVSRILAALVDMIAGRGAHVLNQAADLRQGRSPHPRRRPPKQWVQGLIRQTWHVDGSAFAKAINNLDEETFQALYGRWDPLEPAQVAELFCASSVRWWIVGGRAARVGAPARNHEDTDVAVRINDLDELRNALSDWHLWEANSGTLRPLLPGDHLTEGCEQLWPGAMLSTPGNSTSSSIAALTNGCSNAMRESACPGSVPCTPSTAFRTSGQRLRCCTRPTSTGPRTGQTWPQPGSILTPGPGWRTRWSSLATTPGRTWHEPARATNGPHTKETKGQPETLTDSRQPPTRISVFAGYARSRTTDLPSWS